MFSDFNDSPESYDYAQAGKKIASLGDKRGESDIFAEAMYAIFFKIRKSPMPVNFLTDCLGQPDFIDSKDPKKVTYIYKWQQMVGSHNFQSSTRFLVINEQVIKILPQDDGDIL
ncbi:hypothetical protein [Parachitinimonas caeni]|uniref:Uncharacterized protein n=1 Tax=Parachitinimonas caeni TaxID=3031301 RepID=A0ABT7E817_9NEIS|nr:hypothetical protein [Parachitinimonas caeni]MDK2127047.1 hypothetical protein [Parachitinimonas caeni]